MKIKEIIIEASEQDQRLQDILSQEFDDEFGNPKLPEYIMLDKPSVVSLAVGYAKRPQYSTGKAIKAAVKQLYPKFNADQSRTKAGKSDEPAKDTVTAPKKQRGAQMGNQNARKFDTDVDVDKKPSVKVPRSLNPLRDIDTTTFGSTVASAARLAKSRMHNLDQFKIKR